MASCFHGMEAIHMKKTKQFTVLMLVTILLLAVTGCGSNANDASGTHPAEQVQSSEQETEEDNSAETTAPDALNEDDRTSEPEESEQLSSGSDILVVYFSRTGEQYGVGVIDEGNTAIAAKIIAEATGADLFEILPVDDHYPMTYNELTDVAKKEQSEKARPAYMEGVPDLSGYSTIFIGAPVWWGDWPMICYTFFENENLTGKTLYPFSTHAGSGLSGFDRKLSSAVPDATVGEGLAIAGTDCQNNKDSVRSKVDDWLSGLGY